jgi:hypothetical protein
MKHILTISFLFLSIIFISSGCGGNSPEKSVCECVKWGQKFDVQIEKELIVNGSSAEMKKFEDEKEEWTRECYEILNPSKMSEIKHLQEELKKCK